MNLDKLKELASDAKRIEDTYGGARIGFLNFWQAIGTDEVLALIEVAEKARAISEDARRWPQRPAVNFAALDTLRSALSRLEESK